MNLSQLNPGQRASILGFHQLSAEVRKRLMIMGILPETPILLIRKAPMGDPLQIEVRGVSLAIREKIAAAIQVEVIG